MLLTFQLEIFINYNKMRNPFTSVTNLAFLRNNSSVSPETKEGFSSRCGSKSKYFEYKKSFMNDTYLLDYNSRRHQQSRYLHVMGSEALRYQPEVTSSNDYYALQDNKCTNKPTECNKFEESQPTDVKTSTIQSCLRNTKDMFNSDYFSNRIQKNEGEENTPKKSSIKRKETNGSSRLRFNNVISINYSRLSQQSSQVQSQAYDHVDMVEEIPQTLYLKSKKLIFHLNWVEDNEL